MQVTFLGAAREVTGSMHLLDAGQDRILLDCGMFQGRRKESDEKNRNLPVDPEGITNVVISHAHIDHSGRLPLLSKNGFRGRIHCTRATADTLRYLLPDSAHIQESDALYLNYKALRAHLHDLEGRKKKGRKRSIQEIKGMLKKGRHELDNEAIHRLMDRHGLEKIRPLYDQEDAEDALGIVDGVPYRRPFPVGREVSCTCYEAGHILGSAFCLVKAQRKGRRYCVLYTGDVGRFDKPILKNPTLHFEAGDREVDLLIMESTYGNRLHEPVADLDQRLKEVLNGTFQRGGSVIIPSFAFGRTQELLYVIHELYRSGAVEKRPVYVDSPLAVNLTRVFGEHPEVYDAEAHEAFLEHGVNPFSFKAVRFVKSVEESMALMRDPRPHIVISASGMCEAGRILHHLRYKMHNRKNTILIVGFMAQHTLGRRILEEGLAYEAAGRQGPPPELRLLGKSYPLAARVVALGGFSAHGDRDELTRFLKESNLKAKRIALVHGEEDQALAFQDHLKGEGFDVLFPKPGETVKLEN